jgi:molybdenum cofactor biosynthesis enzyme MoaA
MEKTNRVKIVTGLKCNIQCVFCYYRDNLTAPNRDFAAIVHDLNYAFRRGIREVDFSGGEPTIHSELPELIRTAKSIGMEKVCVITNGLRLSSRSYLHSLKEAGLDEVLFSVHGPSAQIHDEITRCPGSFLKIMAALENAAAAGLPVRVNTVVNRLNYSTLAELGAVILPFSPAQVNFITINDWCFAKHLVERYMLPYAEMAPRLKEACLLLAPRVPALNVRYIPFCFMQGYERFVCNHQQVMYDPYEWVPRVRARLEQGTSLGRYLAILGYGLFACGALRKLRRLSWADTLDESVVAGLRRWFYTKSAACKNCRYAELCDGVEKTYAATYGVAELLPVSGQKLVDPVHFRRGELTP